MSAADEIEPADALAEYGRLYRLTGGTWRVVHLPEPVEENECYKAPPPADMLEVTHPGEIPHRADVCGACLAQVADR